MRREEHAKGSQLERLQHTRYLTSTGSHGQIQFVPLRIHLGTCARTAILSAKPLVQGRTRFEGGGVVCSNVLILLVPFLLHV